jgi:putative toxin-antitoxin system antitoxin component (TIGR02293 family)
MAGAVPMNRGRSLLVITTSLVRRMHIMVLKKLTPLAVAGEFPLTFEGDIADVIRQMRAGTSADAVPAVAAVMGLSEAKLLELLCLSKSTITGRMSEAQALSVAEQDRIYRAENVYKRAVEVLGNREGAQSWVVQPNRALGGEVPLALLDTEAGYELVLNVLGHIAYGIVA